MKKSTAAFLLACLCLALLPAPARSQSSTPPPAVPALNQPFALPIPIQYNALYATAGSDLRLIDAFSGTDAPIGPIGFSGTDIAFSGTDLFGVDFSNFIHIDPTTGAGQLVGPLGYGGVNALTIAQDGSIYAANLDGDFLKIDRTTGGATLIGNMGPGYGSAGDIAISDQNWMYGAVNRSGYSSTWLVSINMTNGAATPIGDIGYGGVWGLSFKDGELYGVTSWGEILKIDLYTGRGVKIGTSSAYYWGLSTSGKALTGSITSPVDNYTTGPASLLIQATAAYPGGSGVKQVEFYVFADGKWQSAGSDTSAPYSSSWTMPFNLKSQQILFRIDVVGNDDRRTEYAGGIRHVNVYQSLGDASIVENWVPNRAYLSQRALPADGDEKCSASSMAMVLAMEGVIARDYQSMADKADEMYPNVLIDGWAYVGKMTQELKRQSGDASYFGPLTNDQGWAHLKTYIDAGHPLIVRSAHRAVTAAGHFVVAVGYQESPGQRKFIAYDPFGQWRGQTCDQLGTANCSGNYYLNAAGDPRSHVGQWVYYDFVTFFGEYLIVSAPASLAPKRALALDAPDLTSDEPKVIGTNPGIETGEGRSGKIYLPQVVTRFSVENRVRASFASLPGDGEVGAIECAAWEACRGAAWGNFLLDGYEGGTVAANYEGGAYHVKRLFLFFDTSSIPAGSEILSATLNIYAGPFQNGDLRRIHAVQTWTGYPLSPVDFSRTGSFSGGYADLSANAWFPISFNSAGLTWIQRGGATSLALVHDYDLYSHKPVERNDSLISLSESGNRPYLTVEYISP